jgi:hypothetical protein
MFKEKYLKYKQKYLELKGGGNKYYDDVIKMYRQFIRDKIIIIDDDDDDDDDPPAHTTILMILTNLNKYYNQTNQTIKNYVDNNKKQIKFAINYALSDAMPQTMTDTINEIKKLTNLQLTL